jgi:spermidine synthase
MVRHNVAVTPQQRQSDPRLTVFLLGVATVVAQALLLREAMAAMGGSELAWGTVMALWLLGMGLGSRIGATRGSERLAPVLPIVVLMFAGSGVIIFRAAPALIGAASGETLTTASAFWLWLLAVAPTAIAGGLAFPMLAGQLGTSGGGRAYAIEAVGALTGGTLLSLVLMGFGAAAALCLTLTAVFGATVWRRSRTLATLIAIAGIWLAPFASESLARRSWSWSDNPGGLRAWRETRLQRIEVSDGFPTTVFADGRLVASYPDPYEVLPRAHLTMLLHPSPSRVLAVGCVVDGSVEAMARHPVDRLVVVEEDPVLLRDLPGWYGRDIAATLGMPQVSPVTTDPLRAVAMGGPWDLVVLRDGDPTTLRRNRTRTLEFLRRCRKHMNPDGILVMRVGVSDTYLGGAAGRLVAGLASTVKEAFPKVSAIPGGEILLVAGGPEAELVLDVEGLSERLENRRVERSELIPEMIPLFVDDDRARSLSERINRGSRVNTVARPRAVMLAGGLHEARSKPALLQLILELEDRGAWPMGIALAIASLALLAMVLSRRPPVVTTAAVVGFGSMGWWLLLIATWQATRGSVYSEIGALTALFMGGLAGAAGLACSWPKPQRHLPLVLAGGVALSLAIASGVAIRLPMVAIPALLIAGGGLTGAAFPGLASLGGRGGRRSAGIAFAADEAGAAIGALVVGIIAIPWAGLTMTALGLGALLLAAIPAMLATNRREEAQQ